MDASLTNAVLAPIVQALAVALVGSFLALVAKGWILLRHQISTVKNRNVRDVMLEEVSAAQQKYGSLLRDPQVQEKVKAEVMAFAKDRLPPTEAAILDSALEAAVYIIKDAPSIPKLAAVVGVAPVTISESASSASSSPPVARTAPFGVTAGSGPVPPAAPGTTMP